MTSNNFMWDTITRQSPKFNTGSINYSQKRGPRHCAWSLKDTLVARLRNIIILRSPTSQAGLILGLHPANERRCYFITTSLIGWGANQKSALPRSDVWLWFWAKYSGNLSRSTNRAEARLILKLANGRHLQEQNIHAFIPDNIQLYD